jgi:hypothetical protein
VPPSIAGRGGSSFIATTPSSGILTTRRCPEFDGSVNSLVKGVLPCGSFEAPQNNCTKKAGFRDSAAESDSGGGQSDEFVSTVSKLEAVAELHEVGAARVPRSNLGNPSGLTGKRRSPVFLHADGISGRKTVRQPQSLHLAP